MQILAALLGNKAGSRSTFTFLVITIPASLAFCRVFLHMTAMAQHFQIRRALILLVPVFVMDA